MSDNPNTYVDPSDRIILDALADVLDDPRLVPTDKLDQAFRIILARRLSNLNQFVAPMLGEVVQGGPFEGMRFSPAVSEGCTIPKLLGCYEAELYPVIAALAERNYDTVLNVGCAEGYYAVGLARSLPAVQVDARDISKTARDRCAIVAAANGVDNRVSIGECFEASDLMEYEGRSVFLLCDIEGGEYELLDPESVPALRKFDLLVELHDVDVAPVDAFRARFAATHDDELIHPEPRDPRQFPALAALLPIDQGLALFERLESTPWLSLRARHR